MEFINNLDKLLFIFFNRSIANPVFDFIFPLITNGRTWVIPGLAAAVYFAIKKKKGSLIVLGAAIITVAVTDPVCYRVLKPLFGRLRSARGVFSIASTSARLRMSSVI